MAGLPTLNEGIALTHFIVTADVERSAATPTTTGASAPRTGRRAPILQTSPTR
jgi:hypothetical protein